MIGSVFRPVGSSQALQALAARRAQRAAHASLRLFDKGSSWLAQSRSWAKNGEAFVP